MKIINDLKQNIIDNIKNILQVDININSFELDLPPEDKLGDYAFACFKLGKNPIEAAKYLADNFQTNKLINKTQANGPYLNLFLNKGAWLQTVLSEIDKTKNYGQTDFGNNKKVVLEFSGPNTNKPQHIGHLRNNILGQALVNIYNAAGFKTVPVNIINDRGIHIMKSMLAWQKWGNNETPNSSGIKGDHLVGKYYVQFGQALKKEETEYYSKNKINLANLDNLSRRKTEDEFIAQSPLMNEARELLKKWEAGDKEVKKLWQMMNSWVYDGYKITYDRLGIKFDKEYYESDTYLLGKDLVELGVEKKVFFKKEDGSIWIDLSKEGLDEKIVLRADGTSVYVTQDLGLAKQRYDEYKFDQAIYVVANEQDYHFKVLFFALQKLGFEWADNLYHLSYGMVNMPDGKIKSREGKTADADDIMNEMNTKAKEIMKQATKKVESKNKNPKQIAEHVGLGALKFFMLGTNPQKNIIYNPQESISFDGYTGTFVQYTHARIANILNKADKIKKLNKLDFSGEFNTEENKLAKLLLDFPKSIQDTAVSYNPSNLTQYLFEVAKTFNNFYQHHSVLQAENDNLKNIRLHLCSQTKQVLKSGLELLGIDAPDVM
jgi:arginyl-tRNA synthetase